MSIGILVWIPGLNAMPFPDEGPWEGRLHEGDN
jgi:hypothetical protein